MNENSIEARVRKIAERVTEGFGLELVHVEFASRGRGTRGTQATQEIQGTLSLVIYIDKPGGVTIADCSAVSLDVGTILDVEDFIPSKYTLEVSSPGLERGLYTRENYQRFKGHAARINTNVKLNGQHRFRGEITDISDDVVAFNDRTNGLVKIPFDSITRANLEVNMEEEFDRANQLKHERKKKKGK
ncbi:MAG: ribosome maturation factor RimP [Pyrinomonadaceae bacterium]